MFIRTLVTVLLFLVMLGLLTCWLLAEVQVGLERAAVVVQADTLTLRAFIFRQEPRQSRLGLVVLVD
jgi:hypothetical protein